MRDYCKISDVELHKLCFVEADKEYIINVIEKTTKQIKNDLYKEIVSVGDSQTGDRNGNV